MRAAFFDNLSVTSLAVDPNDGTRNFVMGWRGASVSIALLRDREPVLGVVFAPTAPDDDGDFFAWADGCGPATRNGKPLEHYIQWAFLTYGITLTGLPAISVPCGFTRSGLPVGLQIVGRRHQEAAVLRAAAAFEAAAPWADKIPAVITAA